MITSTKDKFQDLQVIVNLSLDFKSLLDEYTHSSALVRKKAASADGYNKDSYKY